MTWHRSTLLEKEDRNYIAKSDIFDGLKTELISEQHMLTIHMFMEQK